MVELTYKILHLIVLDTLQVYLQQRKQLQYLLVPSTDPNYLTAHPTISAATSSDNSGRTYIQDITLDSFGHIIGISTAEETVTVPSWVPSTDPNYLTAHPTISAATSSDNSGRTYIQDITLDSFGHITGISTAEETVTVPSGFLLLILII